MTDKSACVIPTLEKLDSLIENNLNKENYVDSSKGICFLRYKYCYPGHIVVLTAQPDSVTTESANVLTNPLYGQYRSSKMTTELVINVKKMTIVDSIRNYYYGIFTDYNTGQYVYPDSFDADLKNQNSNGIHYFLTLEQALMYGVLLEDILQENEEIIYTDYYPDGSICTRGLYKNCQKEGEWTLFFENGQVQEVSNYFNNIRHGKFVKYTDTGVVLEQGLYEYGEQIGDWEFLRNGTIKIVDMNTGRTRTNKRLLVFR